MSTPPLNEAPGCVHHWVITSRRRRAWGTCTKCPARKHFPTLMWRCSVDGEPTPQQDITGVFSPNPGHRYLCPKHLAALENLESGA